MKRWNHKGSTHAKLRMVELRARKERLATVDLMYEWATATGRTREQVAEWWTLAQMDGLRPGCCEKNRQTWLRNAIRSTEETAV